MVETRERAMYRMVSDSCEVTGLTLEGVRRALKWDGITVHVDARSLSYGPIQAGEWVVIAM